MLIRRFVRLLNHRNSENPTAEWREIRRTSKNGSTNKIEQTFEDLFIPVATNHTIPEPVPELVQAPTAAQYEVLAQRLELILNQIAQQEQDNESAREQLRDLARGKRLYRPPNDENRIILDFDDDYRFYDLWKME